MVPKVLLSQDDEISHGTMTNTDGTRDGMAGSMPGGR